MIKQILPAFFFFICNSLFAQINAPQREIALIITEASENLSAENMQVLNNEITRIFNKKGVEISDSVNYTRPQENYFTFRVDLFEKTGKISVTNIGTTGLYTAQVLYPEEIFEYVNVGDITENVNRYIEKKLKL